MSGPDECDDSALCPAQWCRCPANILCKRWLHAALCFSKQSPTSVRHPFVTLFITISFWLLLLQMHVNNPHGYMSIYLSLYTPVYHVWQQCCSKHANQARRFCYKRHAYLGGLRARWCGLHGGRGGVQHPHHHCHCPEGLHACTKQCCQKICFCISGQRGTAVTLLILRGPTHAVCCLEGPWRAGFTVQACYLVV